MSCPIAHLGNVGVQGIGDKWKISGSLAKRKSVGAEISIRRLRLR